jgi:hypothetical protein
VRLMRTAMACTLAAGLFTAAFAQDAAKFEAKFEEKKAFYQEMVTEVMQTIKVQGGTDLTQKHTQTFYFAWTPEKYDKDKATWTLKQKIEGVKMAIDVAGNPINYDSTKTDSVATTNPGLADFYKNLIGTEFTVSLKNGAVEKVDGKDELLKKLGSANAQMEALLKKVLSDEALKQMSDPTFGLTPAKEMKKDESWEKKSSINLGPIGSYDLTYKFTYKGKDADKKELDRVEILPTLAYKPPAEGGDGLLFRIKPGGKLETVDPKPGFLLFDPKTGRVVTSQIKVVLKGQLNVTVGGTDTTVDLYQEQTTTVNTKDTSYVNPTASSTSTPITPPPASPPAAPPAGDKK